MSVLTAAARWVQAMLQEEPVLTLAVIQSGVAMLVGFGLRMASSEGPNGCSAIDTNVRRARLPGPR
jgi:hypothetical protein